MSGETAFIEALQANQPPLPPGLVGIGDDCCIWPAAGDTCLSVDSLVEGVHFTAEAAPEAVGRKAAAAALSDLAAMGALPIGAVVALHGGRGWNLSALMRGLAEELACRQCPLLGGDTCSSEQLIVSVTVWGGLGPAGRFVRRTGAGLGDLLVVTGALGGSLQSGRHLRPIPRLWEGQWLAQQSAVRAMLDLSDGLAADARRLATANGCGALLLLDGLPIHADVPDDRHRFRRACCDGEDYELLCAVAAHQWPDLASRWPFEGAPLSVVGWLIDRPGLFIEAERDLQEIDWGGYEHQLDTAAE